mgnify:CR=1 FL=1
MGYVGWVGTVSKTNAVLVKLLLDQGAVVYVKTNGTSDQWYTQRAQG